MVRYNLAPDYVGVDIHSETRRQLVFWYIATIAAATICCNQTRVRVGVATLRPCPRQELFDLLRRLFSTIELRIFLSHGSEGEDILAALPESSCLIELVFEAIEQLDRRGLVTERLFLRLVRERPHQVQDISLVAQAWGFDVPMPRTGE